uniref:Uncharacterized protein n=1 Tax=Ditylum brightwellii TaxID=49249 RepID=A0A7S4SIT9_9STRA
MQKKRRFPQTLKKETYPNLCLKCCLLWRRSCWLGCSSRQLLYHLSLGVTHNWTQVNNLQMFFTTSGPHNGYNAMVCRFKIRLVELTLLGMWSYMALPLIKICKTVLQC